MIASLVNSGLALFVGLTVALLTLRLASHAFLLRRQGEFQRQLLELLHLAVSREQALSPVLERAARETRKLEQGWLQQITAALDGGAPLAAALRKCRRAGFAPHVLIAIEAAEGSAQLPSVLADLARREDHARALRFRVLMAASYPTLLSLLLLLLGTFWWFASWAQEFTGIVRVDLWPWVLTAAIVSSGVWLLLAFGGGHGWWSRGATAIVRRLPWLGLRLQLLPAARALQTLSSLVASGATLATALRHAGHGAADARSADRFARAAELADSGALPDEVWPATGLPDFVTARVLTCRSANQELATCLAELNDECHRRCSDAIQRSVSVMQPVVVLGFGVIVALQFSQIFAWLDVCRGMAMESMPW